jgi:AcrR family transcriptional regulator
VTVTDQASLRERKKQRTREAISDAAIRLFAKRGFEGVSVAEIAAAAEVSEKTVFNYFPTKEDLVYSRQTEVEEQLLAAVREHGPVEGMRRFLVDVFAGLAEQGAPDVMATRARIVAASPTLQARELWIFAELTRMLAKELGDDTQAWVVAIALVGVNRALLHSARDKVLAGLRGKRLVNDVRTELDAALDLLGRGLGSYR